GCRCYLLNDYEDVGKLKAKWDIRVFVRYSKESAAFRIYNKRTRFVSKQYPNHVYAIDKALYGLKEAPRAWYDVLSQFLIESGFQKAIKRIFRYLKRTINLCLWYPKDSGFDLTAYSDADHAGCHLDRKTESKYVAVSSCCAQVLRMRAQLTDYGFFYDKVPIYCDSKSAIAISCNPVQHTRTKHIDVRKEGVRFSASIFEKKRSLL
nr:hypothetical protein [Tanacetum cinerariifolium]